ncbi:replication initiation protein RepM, partial [Acinetobacter gerneri]
MANDLVVKSNTLINASYSLTLAEQRLIGLAIVKANNQHKEVDTNTMLVVTAAEYVDMFKVDRAAAYMALKDASERLFSRYFTYDIYSREYGKEYDLKPPRKLSTSDDLIKVKSRWVQKIAYRERSGAVYFQFSTDLIPLITNLKEYFTSYYLSQTADFSSSYATRLFELLMQWKSTNSIPVMALHELRNSLGVEENQYKLVADFKKRVLDIAVNQINETTDYKIEYEQHKEGRTITGFSFKFKLKNSKSKAQIDSKRDPNTPDFFIKMTDAQRHLFANKMSEMPEMSKYSQGTESYQQFAVRIAEMLLQPEKFRELYPLLE